MNTIFRIATVTVLTLLFTTLASADEIRLATQPSPQFAPIFVAKQKQWLEEELAKIGARSTIKWTSFAAGPPMNEAFAAGQLDIGFLGDTPAIIGKSAGINIRVVGLSSSGPKALAVVVANGSAIKSPKELKGKKVAVVKGSFAHHLLVLVLRKGGLKANDIEMINLSQADIATAIVNGTVDAAAIWEPLITKLEEKGAVRILADGTGIKKGLLVTVAANDFLGRNREQMKAILRAYQRAARYIKSNPKEAARLISADVNLPPDTLVKVLAKFDYRPAILAGDLEDLKQSEAFMRGTGLTRSAVNIDSFVDVAVTREAGLK